MKKTNIIELTKLLTNIIKMIKKSNNQYRLKYVFNLYVLNTV
jgi:hypothetical protein